MFNFINRDRCVLPGAVQQGRRKAQKENDAKAGSTDATSSGKSDDVVTTEEKDEKKMEKVEEEIVSKEEAEKMKELRRRVQDLAEDNEYVQSNLSDQAMVRKRSYANSQHTHSQNR